MPLEQMRPREECAATKQSVQGKNAGKKFNVIIERDRSVINDRLEW
jgi:hypothetical protein